ncbi:MAG: two-component system, cell cycle sensor histidine kinase and response regulator CckA [Verrucomicrobiota bacterium]|jgi:signal transduction histidine kinase
MKVQTKITLLLALVVATFLGGVLAFRAYDRSKLQRIAQERFDERTRSFDEFIVRNGEPLQTVVEDFTCLDQMVQAIATEDYQWCGENLNNSTLSGYHANAVWIYKPDGTVFYPHNNLNAPELREIPVSREALPRIFARERLRHFFIKVPQGVMEIRAGTIHPSRDFRRETTPQGYFFVGRLWNRPTLDEMAAFTGNKIDIASAGDRTAEIQNDSNGSISFYRLLPGWDGKPISRLVIRSESPLVQELNRESSALLIALIIFALLLLLLISSSLVRWVHRPLRTITESLRHSDPKPIESMKKDNSEFGQLARTVHEFFKQQDNLIREMEERRATEEALRKSEDELRHAQKMEAVGRLAGGVAHDFNNLLTAIIGYAELLAHRAVDDPTTREHAELIRQTGEQAAILTRQLLAFSRKQILQPKVLDLNKLVVDMELLLRRVIGERFELKTLPQAEDGRVKADPSQLEQVILNLGVNARDAMPAGGKLTIRTSNVYVDGVKPADISNPLPSGNYVVLAVADTGAGMDKETKTRIFDPFFTTKGPGKGTGLGLATVYGIVRQSGGGIAVDSEPGHGSTFRIFLPHETSPVNYYRPSPAPIDQTRSTETVLVVEDEKIVRELVCDILQQQGYTVLCAENGATALEMAREFEREIHLLVTDVIMPQMNGHELAQALAETRPEMKVLFVSGYSDNELGEHGMLGPGIELLQKPFTPQSLSQKIRALLGPSGMEDNATSAQLHFAELT